MCFNMTKKQETQKNMSFFNFFKKSTIIRLRAIDEFS